MSTLRGSTRGFTLMELVITMLVVAVGISLAIPTYDNIMQRRENTAKAEELASFLAFARSEAVKINDEVTVSVSWTDANDWCIGAMRGNSPCDCDEIDQNASNFCAIQGRTHMLDASGYEKSSMHSYLNNDAAFTFDPIRGTKSADMDDMTDHFFIMRSDNKDWALRVNVGPTGRVRVCVPHEDDISEAFKDTPGFEDCEDAGVLPIIPIIPTFP